MKIDNEVMWNTAEQFAKVVNDAYQKRFEHDNMLTNKETFVKVVGWIVNGETKKALSEIVLQLLNMCQAYRKSWAKL